MEQKNNILFQMIAIGVGTAISMILSFLSTPIITRIVNPEILGKVSIFDVYTSLGVMILCLGMDQALIRFFYDKDSMAYKRSLARLCIAYPVRSVLIVSVLFLALCYYHIIPIAFEMGICVILCFNVFLAVIHRIIELLLRVTYSGNSIATFNVLGKFSYVLSSLFLLLILRIRHIYALIFAEVSSFIIPLLYGAIKTRNYLFARDEKQISIDKKAIVAYSIPLIFSLGIITLFQSIDRLALEYFRDYYDVGIYTSATAIVSVFAIIQNAFTTMWAPMQVEHFTNHPDDKEFYQNVHQIIVVIMFFLGNTIILCKDLVILLLGNKYRIAVSVVPFLIFSPIMFTISETNNVGITYSKKSHLTIWTAVFACGTNFVGDCILVPSYGCVGAAVSTAVSYIVFWALRLIFSNKYYYVDYQWWKMLCICSGTIGYAFYNVFHSFDAVSFGIYIAIVCMTIALYKKTVRYIFKYSFMQVMKLLKH